MAATNVQRFSGDVILSGNMNLQKVSNTATIKLDSNVVTEFNRSKKLIKYPRVALTQDDESSTTGYVADASTEESINTGPWKAFNGDGGAWETTPRRFNQNTGDWDGTTTTPYAISLVGSDTIYGEWVELKIPNKIQLHTCRIAPMTNSTYPNLGKHRSPRDGYILGRVGATGNWTVLKSWSGLIGGWEDLVLRDFDIENQLEYYDYFRVVWTAINGNNNYSVNAGYGYASAGEIEFLGVPEYDPDAHGTDVTVKSVANVPNTDWLEVYYDAKGLNAGAVSTVNDLKPSSLGSALNSSSTNNITVADDAFVFNGTDSNVYINDLTNPSGAWIHSVAAWVKFTDFDSSQEVSWIGDADGSAIRQSFSFQPGGETVTMGISGSNVQFRFTSPLTPGKWHHVVYTYNGGSSGSASTAYQVFIDGVEASKFAGVGTGTLTLPADSALWIGTNHNGTNHFGGSVANFRLFNRALTSDEIYQLYAYQKKDFGHGDLSMTLKAGRLGIGTSEPRAALDVRGDTFSTLYKGGRTTFLTWDYLGQRSTVFSAAGNTGGVATQVNILDNTFDIPSCYHHLGTANLKAYVKIDWRGESQYSWNFGFTIEVTYNGNQIVYSSSSDNSSTSGNKINGLPCISADFTNFDSTPTAASVTSMFSLPNCDVSSGSQLKVQLVGKHGDSGTGQTLWTGRTKGFSTTSPAHELPTTSFFVVLDVEDGY